MKLLCTGCSEGKDAVVVYQGSSLCAACFLKRKDSEDGTENQLMGFKP